MILVLSVIKRFYTVSRKGIRYHLDLTEIIDASLFTRGEWEPGTCCFLRSELKPGDTVIEVGANIGAHTLLIAKLCSQGKVYAFEPTDYASTKLRRNLELNPALSNVTIVQKLVSDTNHALPKSQITGSFALAGPSTQFEDVNVPCVSIDEFVCEAGIHNLGLLKIDVDGYDFLVLKGASQVLRDLQPVVLVEMVDDENHLAACGSSARAIREFMSDHGYTFIKMIGENAHFAPNNTNVANG
jgi:FkbM family methyltransferase